MKKNKTVFVGLSGGVDSGVSAALLKDQGYVVVGVFIRTWHPDFLECNEEEERRDAMRIAAHLDIPFITFDLEEVYKKEVADYMISEYKLGRTPNPDVMCNKEVKFGAFLSKALSMGADFVATGHYSQTKKMVLSHGSHSVLKMKTRALVAKAEESTSFCLLKGSDPTKDQSYFLWTLSQERLSKILFPVGGLPKTDVRKLALKYNLPVATKKDSQGICFLGAIDLKEFLKHYIKEKKGNVVNERGEIIGHHEGAVFHTLGERHGFTLTQKTPHDGAYYVMGKDIKKNILVVSQNPTLPRLASRHPSPFTDGEGKGVRLMNVNWIYSKPEDNKTYTAQIRYHGEFLPCTVLCATSDVAQVIFEKSVLVAAGQSIVVYDKNICLGGGVVV